LRSIDYYVTGSRGGEYTKGNLTCFSKAESYLAYKQAMQKFMEAYNGGKQGGFDALERRRRTLRPRRSFWPSVVADERKLYTGTSSFLDLDVQKLTDDLHDGLIKQDEYERKLTVLLSGKVTETN